MESAHTGLYTLEHGKTYEQLIARSDSESMSEARV
jgi:hypothetical protein